MCPRPKCWRRRLRKTRRRTEESVLSIKTGVKQRETGSEITAEETATAFAALSVLCPNLTGHQPFRRTNQHPPARRRIPAVWYFRGRQTQCGVSMRFPRSVQPSQRPPSVHRRHRATLPQSRNKGYASRLLREVRKTAAEAGIAKIHLNVHVDQERARPPPVFQ